MDLYKEWFYPSASLMHHGIEGQKWGVRNGPPYPIGSGSGVSNESKKDETPQKSIDEVVDEMKSDGWRESGPYDGTHSMFKDAKLKNVDAHEAINIDSDKRSALSDISKTFKDMEKDIDRLKKEFIDTAVEYEKQLQKRKDQYAFSDEDISHMRESFERDRWIDLNCAYWSDDKVPEYSMTLWYDDIGYRRFISITDNGISIKDGKTHYT